MGSNFTKLKGSNGFKIRAAIVMTLIAVFAVAGIAFAFSTNTSSQNNNVNDDPGTVALSKTTKWCTPGDYTKAQIELTGTGVGKGIDHQAKVLFLGTLCSAHSLNGDKLITAINACSYDANADVDYFLFNGQDKSGTDQYGSLSHGTKLTKEKESSIKKQFTTGNHKALNKFLDTIYNQVESKKIEYDCIILEFDRTILAHSYGQKYKSKSMPKCEHEAEVAEIMKGFYNNKAVVWLVKPDEVYDWYWGDGTPENPGKDSHPDQCPKDEEGHYAPTYEDTPYKVTPKFFRYNDTRSASGAEIHDWQEVDWDDEHTTFDQNKRQYNALKALLAPDYYNSGQASFDTRDVIDGIPNQMNYSATAAEIGSFVTKSVVSIFYYNLTFNDKIQIAKGCEYIPEQDDPVKIQEGTHFEISDNGIDYVAVPKNSSAYKHTIEYDEDQGLVTGKFDELLYKKYVKLVIKFNTPDSKGLDFTKISDTGNPNNGVGLVEMHMNDGDDASGIAQIEKGKELQWPVIISYHVDASDASALADCNISFDGQLKKDANEVGEDGVKLMTNDPSSCLKGAIASPGPGWVFENWTDDKTGDVVSTGASWKAPFDDEHNRQIPNSYTAHFKFTGKISKDGPETAIAGQDYKYTFKVENGAAEDASVTVVDNLANYKQYFDSVSAEDPEFSYDEKTGVAKWTNIVVPGADSEGNPGVKELTLTINLKDNLTKPLIVINQAKAIFTNTMQPESGVVQTKVDPRKLTVEYSLNPDASWGVPEEKIAPDASTVSYGDSYTVEEKQTTTWKTHNGEASGIPGKWIFSGWSEDQSTYTPVEKYTSLTSDKNLYGKWTFNPDDVRLSYEVADDPTWGHPTFDQPKDASVPYGTKNYELDPSCTTKDTSAHGVPGKWEFTGWFSDEERTIPIADNILPGPIVNNTTVYGKWTFTPDTYVLRYHDAGDPTYGYPLDREAVDPVTGIEWDASVKLADPLHSDQSTATGDASSPHGKWVFEGWSDKEGDYSEDHIIKEVNHIKSDTDVYGQWKFVPKKITLKFDLNGHGGSIPPSDQSMDSGKCGQNPDPEPTDPSYNFEGWYLDASTTMPILIPLTPLYEDTTVYAKWVEKDKINLFYVPISVEDKTVVSPTEKGGQTDPYTEILYMDQSANGSVAKANEGWTFIGWNVLEDPKNPPITPHEGWTDPSFIPQKPSTGWVNDTTYAAIFVHDKVGVKYVVEKDASFGVPTDSKTPPDASVFYGNNYKVGDKCSTKEHSAKDSAGVVYNGDWVFDGWYIDSGYETPAPATLENMKADATLYGKWTFNPDVNIYYESEDASRGSVTRDYDTLHPISGKATGSKAEPMPGYHFVNWTKGEDIVSEQLSFVPVKEASEKWIDGTTYVAHFEENSPVNIYYKANEGGKVSNPQDTVAPATGNPSGSVAEANQGYEFVSWALNGKEVSTDADFTPSKKPGELWVEGTTYYANFKRIELPVHYQVAADPSWGLPPEDASSRLPSDASVYYGETYKVERKCTTDSGLAKGVPGKWTFTGWALNNESYSPVVVEVPNVKEAVDLFGKWSFEPRKYTVTFDMQGHGKQVPKQVVDYKEKVQVPSPEPSEPGYQFTGWKNEDGTDFDFDTPITQDTIIFASWELLDKVPIHYVADVGGSVDPSCELLNPEIGEAKGSLAKADKGYSFDYWTNEDGQKVGENVKYTPDRPGGGWVETTFTAHFKEDADVTIFYISADASTGSVDPGRENLAPASGVAKGSTATPKEGYEFDYWANSEGKKIEGAGATWAPEKEKGTLWIDGTTFVAHFKEKSNVNIYYISEDASKGSVNNPLDSLAPVTGIPSGSTAIPAKGYKFVDWTLQSTGEEVSVDASFTPKKAEGSLWIDGTTYVAHFEPITTSMNVRKYWTDGEQTHTSDSVGVNLHKVEDGSDVVLETITLNADNNWNIDMDNLRVYDASGNLIKYYIAELDDGSEVINHGTYHLTKNKTYTVGYAYTNDPISLATTAATVTNTYNALPSDIHITKTADKKIAEPGQDITYTIKVQNNAPGAYISNVNVEDPLPKELNYVSSNPAGAYDQEAHKLCWTIGKIEQGSSAQITVVCKVPVYVHSKVYVNTAQVISYGGVIPEEEIAPPEILNPPAKHELGVNISKTILRDSSDYVFTNESQGNHVTLRYYCFKYNTDFLYNPVIVDTLPKGLIPDSPEKYPEGVTWVPNSDGTYTFTMKLGSHLVDDKTPFDLPAVVDPAIDKRTVLVSDASLSANVEEDQSSESVGATSNKTEMLVLVNVKPDDPIVPPDPPVTDIKTIRVDKVWDDGALAHENDQVTMTLYADGVENSSQVLSSKNAWTYTWKDMPVLRDDKKTEIVYTVKETVGLAGYEAKYETDKDDNVTVTNCKEYVPPVPEPEVLPGHGSAQTGDELPLALIVGGAVVALFFGFGAYRFRKIR